MVFCGENQGKDSGSEPEQHDETERFGEPRTTRLRPWPPHRNPLPRFPGSNPLLAVSFSTARGGLLLILLGLLLALFVDQRVKKFVDRRILG